MPKQPTKPFVFLIDDDAETLEALGDLLRATLPGVEIGTEMDPKAALDALKIHPPDVLIADYRMHPMDGLDFLQRSREFAPDAKRILASAYPGDIRTDVDLDLVLVKPLDTGPFVERIRRLL